MTLFGAYLSIFVLMPVFNFPNLNVSQLILFTCMFSSLANYRHVIIAIFRLVEWLDEYSSVSFRQAQVSFSSRLPKAFPIMDASTMACNLLLYCNYSRMDIKSAMRISEGEMLAGGGVSHRGVYVLHTPLTQSLMQQALLQDGHGIVLFHWPVIHHFPSFQWYWFWQDPAPVPQWEEWYLTTCWYPMSSWSPNTTMVPSTSGRSAFASVSIQFLLTGLWYLGRLCLWLSQKSLWT